MNGSLSRPIHQVHHIPILKDGLIITNQEHAPDFNNNTFYDYNNNPKSSFRNTKNDSLLIQDNSFRRNGYQKYQQQQQQQQQLQQQQQQQQQQLELQKQLWELQQQQKLQQQKILEQEQQLIQLKQQSSPQILQNYQQQNRLEKEQKHSHPHNCMPCKEFNPFPDKLATKNLTTNQMKITLKIEFEKKNLQFENSLLNTLRDSRKYSRSKPTVVTSNNVTNNRMSYDASDSNDELDSINKLEGNKSSKSYQAKKPPFDTLKIQPPSYQNYSLSSIPTFQPNPQNNLNSSRIKKESFDNVVKPGLLHTRSKSMLVQQSPKSNVTSAFNESVELIPIKLKHLETYVPRLTVQDNKASTQPSRSKSLIRANALDETTFDKSNLVKKVSLERSVVENKPFRSPQVSESSNVVGSNVYESTNVNEPVKDSNEFSWYRPNMTRDAAIAYLLKKPSGSFVVRNSSSYPGSYALVIKVDPVHGSKEQTNENDVNSVRHFLIETSPTGAKLMGYKTEVEFDNLKALIDYHSKTPLALPCRLLLPSNTQSLEALHVLSVPVEVSSDIIAINRTFEICVTNICSIGLSRVNLNTNINGIQIDSEQKITHLKRFYPYDDITYCGVDPQLKRLPISKEINSRSNGYLLFGFLVRGSSEGDECHVFAVNDDHLPLFIETVNKNLKFV
ncbi:hypothetical protein HELRODRAFT_193036 [Helobdella robusta]|uniref:SH2 domain-containing protein n=1 Tax=Helobdella robusta TaxID=6412 RepID=T1FUJ8_HELRO|nr:hypothetical protein HELRODRAFT_193036 [Helobdella robusta]ESN98302.1 hypothetical protein HELRODRAFT_193036 [Helobdella robusta]